MGLFGGDKQDQTADLKCNVIQSRSQLVIPL